MATRRSVVQGLGAAFAVPGAANAVAPVTPHGDDCVFCRIDAGELESVVLWRDDRCIAIADRFPYSAGHALLMPRAHYGNLYELPEDLAAHMYAFAPRLARELKREFSADGITCIQNNERAGGQTVFHYHMHFVPRTTGVEILKRVVERPEVSIEVRERQFAPLQAALAR
jgi:histidine triad (HIT) family protein